MNTESFLLSPSQSHSPNQHPIHILLPEVNITMIFVLIPVPSFTHLFVSFINFLFNLYTFVFYINGIMLWVILWHVFYFVLFCIFFLLDLLVIWLFHVDACSSDSFFLYLYTISFCNIKCSFSSPLVFGYLVVTCFSFSFFLFCYYKLSLHIFL